MDHTKSQAAIASDLVDAVAEKIRMNYLTAPRIGRSGYKIKYGSFKIVKKGDTFVDLEFETFPRGKVIYVSISTDLP